MLNSNKMFSALKIFRLSILHISFFAIPAYGDSSFDWLLSCFCSRNLAFQEFNTDIRPSNLNFRPLSIEVLEQAPQQVQEEEEEEEEEEVVVLEQAPQQEEIVLEQNPNQEIEYEDIYAGDYQVWDHDTEQDYQEILTDIARSHIEQRKKEREREIEQKERERLVSNFFIRLSMSSERVNNFIFVYIPFFQKNKPNKEDLRHYISSNLNIIKKELDLIESELSELANFMSSGEYENAVRNIKSINLLISNTIEMY